MSVTLTARTAADRLTLEVRGLPLGSFQTSFEEGWQKKLKEANLSYPVTLMVLDIDDFGGVTDLIISEDKICINGQLLSGLVRRVKQTLGAELVDKHPKPHRGIFGRR